MKRIEEIIQEINHSPEFLHTTFNNPLTLQEEFLLTEIELELACKADAILDRAMAGGLEITISESEKQFVLEAMRIRRMLQALLTERGTLRHGMESMN
ncbi:MAG: hypothetical protein AAF570_00115 [Bacteroidota bacterium]